MKSILNAYIFFWGRRKDSIYVKNATGKLQPFLENTTAHASVLSITLISLERYCAICRPFHAQTMCTTPRTVKMILVTWVIALVSSSPFLAIAKVIDATYVVNQEAVKICSTAIDTNWKQVYIVLLFLLYFCIPILVLMVIYIRIGTVLVAEGVTLTKANGRRTKQRRQLVGLLVGIIVMFFVCVLPVRIFTLWLIFGTSDSKQWLSIDSQLNLLSFVRMAFYLNSAVNPVLYNMLSSNFRHAFATTVFVCKRRRRRRRVLLHEQRYGYFRWRGRSERFAYATVATRSDRRFSQLRGRRPEASAGLIFSNPAPPILPTHRRLPRSPPLCLVTSV
ncbi:gastrin/cholecystokinin type B receptor [Lingula anatina]|uniref:Gastrin/cholecystokinin type B receptor n=1 Tax=Lingula anatina TaxID=7574 RepID=A0A1S3HCZ7_LINAN|nr:gastrin/cholecystokinin type B receptor [Lingula anatina]|eukprot:XP_013383401.1 gastrin/cholecystokinin type B receptor [Lingula anatina]